MTFSWTIREILLHFLTDWHFSIPFFNTTGYSMSSTPCSSFFWNSPFKIWILKCWSWSVYTSTFFHIHKRNWKFGFLKSLDCTCNFFKFSTTSSPEQFWDFRSPHAFIMMRIVFQYNRWSKIGGTKLLLN